MRRLLLVLLVSTPALAQTRPVAVEAKETRWDDFDDYRLGLFIQDLMTHRSRSFTKIWNDNRSDEISQSALLKRVALRVRVSPRLDVGGSLHMSLRDEATVVDGQETDTYHPFKAATLIAGYRVLALERKRLRAELWLSGRAAFALTRNVLEKSALQIDVELVLVFHGNALVTFGVESSANLDDGFFFAAQYGVGYRF